MKITILDSVTLGDDISLENFSLIGETDIYPSTPQELVEERISDCDVIVVNKVKLNETNLAQAKNLKLILPFKKYCSVQCKRIFHRQCVSGDGCNRTVSV